MSRGYPVPCLTSQSVIRRCRSLNDRRRCGAFARALAVGEDELVADLIIVTGPPGAGKTTVARLLSNMFDKSALVPGDDFFGFIDQGYLDPWTATAHRQNEIVVDAAAAAAGRLAAGGYTVVYDGVIGPWFVDAFTRATGLTQLHYAVLLPPEQLCLRRVASRVGHGFTDVDAARHMYAQFANAHIDNRHVVTAPDDATTIAERLHHLVQDESIVRAIERLPNRAC